jgi:hypothetical protein
MALLASSLRRSSLLLATIEIDITWYSWQQHDKL